METPASSKGGASAFRTLDGAFRTLECLWPFNLLIYLCLAPLAELCFYWHTQAWLARRSSAPHDTRVPADTHAVLQFWSRILAEDDPAALWSVLRGWFEGAALPRRGNVLAFVTWTLYGAAEPDGAEEARICEAVLSRIEAVLCGRLAPGHASLRCSPHTASL